MPVRIRLQRVGKRDNRLFRLVVCDQHGKANGKTLAILGSVNLKAKLESLKYDKAEFDRWKNQGAQPSDSVRKLISL